MYQIKEEKFNELIGRLEIEIGRCLTDDEFQMLKSFYCIQNEYPKVTDDDVYYGNGYTSNI